MEDRGLGLLENRGSGTGGARGKRGKCKFSKATNFTIEKGLKGGRIPLNLVPRAFSLRSPGNDVGINFNCYTALAW